MKKKGIILLVFFLRLSNILFCNEEKSEKGLLYVQTKYFDIIYAPSSRQSAAHLAEKADTLYEEIARMYNLKYDFRMPVFFISNDDTFNGYFSASPFNHIVLYDAPVTSDMAVFSDTVVSVFRHELTHAISYNVREGFSRFIKVTFGDAMNFGFFVITTAWAEGAAVSSESMHGEGRVNDEYSMHMVKQAKIEDRFPRYSEVNGSKDVYPYTRQSYAFGGAFNAWLQQKYGMDKYAQFWNIAVNAKSLTYFTAFKKVYGKPLKEVWHAWQKDVVISSDLRSTHPWSQALSKELSIHTSLSAGGGMFCYYNEAESTIYVLKALGEKSEKMKTVKMQGVSRVHLSKEGSILSVSFTERGITHTKNRVTFYNLRNGDRFSIEENGVKDASTFYFANSLYAVVVKAKGQASCLKVYKIEGEALTECASFEAEERAAIFSPVGMEDGNVVFIYKKGLSFSIRLFNIKTKEMREIFLPFERAVIRNVSVCDKTLSFSWTMPGVMPRVGFIDLKDGNLRTQRYDISGGIFSPVLSDGQKGFYIAHYFSGTKIMRMDREKMETDATDISIAVIKDVQAEAAKKDILAPPLKGEKPFSACAFLFKKRGTFIPLSSLMTYAVDTESLLLKSMPMPIGVSYITSTPWTSPIVYAHGGYSITHASGGFGLSVTGATKTSRLFYDAKGSVLFDNKGYQQSYSFLGTNCSIPLSDSGIVQAKVREGITLFHGRQSDFSKSLSFNPATEKFSSFIHRLPAFYEGTADKRLFIQNTLGFGLSTVRYAGYEKYEKRGFYAEVVWHAVFLDTLKAVQTKENSIFSNNIGLHSRVYFPRMLPFKNRVGITLNMPFLLSLNVLPNRIVLLDAGIKSILFSKEIQWAGNFCPVLYINRFTLEAGYIGVFLNKKYGDPYLERIKEIGTIFTGSAVYTDFIEVKAKLEMTPNIGGFARRDFLFDIDVTVKYSPTRRKWSLSLCTISFF